MNLLVMMFVDEIRKRHELELCCFYSVHVPSKNNATFLISKNKENSVRIRVHHQTNQLK